MKKTWKHTAIYTLILIGMMQVIPLVPTHHNCQAACCATVASCCDTEGETGCDMAMTSCNVTLFIPLISAPLIKVESNVHLDMTTTPRVSFDILPDQFQFSVDELLFQQKAPPPVHTPLLI
ncbi:MAG: hypothetical protein K9M55_00825 [Candidatus Marinimicrobia bacterium]|nr:hypothetical protein [Candidatus Neomarinimicrobiota bacterium]MCF7921220.1 hypothetical protein [Candidatus Neomarinimicrobiota bacterium]